MPRYSIVRNVPGATQEDIDASSMRAIWCLAEYPKVKWIRSYWDPEAEQIRCIYDAPNEQMIRDHSANARIPCDDVREVAEFGPETYLAPREASVLQ